LEPSAEVALDEISEQIEEAEVENLPEKIDEETEEMGVMFYYGESESPK